MKPAIQITEEGRPPIAELQAPANPRFDFQDWLLLLGFLSLESGVALIYPPAALILGGLLCFGFAFLIQKDRMYCERKQEKRGIAQS